MSGSVKNHMEDASDIDHVFVIKPSMRDVVVVVLKVGLLALLFASMFLFGAMYGAHKAANDPEFVKEYLTATETRAHEQGK